ncbi:hypothetical protein PO909_004486 [Leuciscus waleckii]
MAVFEGRLRQRRTSQFKGCILGRSHLKADCVTRLDEGCPNSVLHPPKSVFEGRLRHRAATKASLIQKRAKCTLRFPVKRRIHKWTLSGLFYPISHCAPLTTAFIYLFLKAAETRDRWWTANSHLNDCKCPGTGEGVSGKPTAETWPFCPHG